MDAYEGDFISPAAISMSGKSIISEVRAQTTSGSVAQDAALMEASSKAHLLILLQRIVQVIVDLCY